MNSITFTPEGLRATALRTIVENTEPGQWMVSGISPNDEEVIVDYDPRFGEKVRIFVRGDREKGIVLRPDNSADEGGRELLTTDTIRSYQELLGTTAFKGGVAGLE